LHSGTGKRFSYWIYT